MDFMSPMDRQREIIQGKVVQTGSYPADWSQDSSLEVTAQFNCSCVGTMNTNQFYEEFGWLQEEQTGKTVFVS